MSLVWSSAEELILKKPIIAGFLLYLIINFIVFITWRLLSSTDSPYYKVPAPDMLKLGSLQSSNQTLASKDAFAHPGGFKFFSLVRR